MAAMVVLVAMTMAAARAQSPSASKAGGDANARAVFQTRCAGCHGLDARGGEAPAIGPGSPAAARTDDRLQTIIRDGTAAGMPGFGALLSRAGIVALVTHLRTLQRSANDGGNSTALPGDPAQGRSLFFGKASCADCHMARGEGGFLGSDLTRTRLDAKAIREAILHPPASPKGVLTSVTLRDGASVSGIVRNEDNFSLQLQDSRGAFHLIDKASATAITRDEKPLMPSDYRQRLSDAELDHLVRYLADIADPTPPAGRKR